MRHRLIPTQGRGGSRYVHGAEEALKEAQEQFGETGIPVLVVLANPGELVKPVTTVGKIPKKKKAA